MSQGRHLPTHRHPFGPGQTQRRALRGSTPQIEVDPMDEAPTYHRDRRPIAEILTGPVPAAATPQRDAGVTMQIARPGFAGPRSNAKRCGGTIARRAPPSTSLVMLWITIGITIGMLAMLAMLRA